MIKLGSSCAERVALDLSENKPESESEFLVCVLIISFLSIHTPSLKEVYVSVYGKCMCVGLGEGMPVGKWLCACKLHVIYRIVFW